MLTNPQLKAARDSLLTTASLSAISADTAAGVWADIARAAETIADTSTTTSETLQGTMQRTAVAIEGITGTDGALENPNYEGLLTRIVDALEDGEVGAGSLANRFVLAAAAFSGGTPTPTVIAPPSIAGTLTNGSTITWTPAVWSTGTATGQWHRDGVPISGQTGLTYTYVAATDDGTYLTVVETNGAATSTSNALIAGENAVVYSTQFTGTDGTNLNGFESWDVVGLSGTLADTDLRILDNDVAIYSNGNGRFYRKNTGSNNHIAKLTIARLSGDTGISSVRHLIVRGGGTRQNLVFLLVQSTGWSLSKRISNTETSLQSFVTRTLADGDLIELHNNGNYVQVWFNGVQTSQSLAQNGGLGWNVSDVPAGQYVGIQPATATGGSQASYPFKYAKAFEVSQYLANSITINTTTPENIGGVPGQQRIRLVGTITGSVTQLQALVLSATGQVLLDWADVSGLSGSAFDAITGTLPQAAEGQSVTVWLRDKTNIETATSSNVAVAIQAEQVNLTVGINTARFGNTGEIPNDLMDIATLFVLQNSSYREVFSPFATVSGSSSYVDATDVAVDDNYFPTIFPSGGSYIGTDYPFYLFAANDGLDATLHGTYDVVFTPGLRWTLSAGGTTMVRSNYNEAAGTATITVTGDTGANPEIRLVGYDNGGGYVARTLPPAGSGYFRAIKQGSAGKRIDPAAIASLGSLVSAFGFSRFMDAVGTNRAAITGVTYTTRTARRPALAVGQLSAGESMSLETILEAAIDTGSNPWICIPDNASSAYVLSVAQFFFDNMPTGMVVAPELSNEMWNFGAAFSQSSALNSRASAAGVTNRVQYSREYKSNVLDHFETVFGVNSPRVHPVLCWQSSITAEQIAEMLNEGSLYQKIKGFGIAPYIGGGVGSSTTDIGDYNQQAIFTQVQRDLILTDEAGFKTAFFAAMSAAGVITQGVWLAFANALAVYCVGKGLARTAIRPAAYEYMWQHILEANTPTGSSQAVLTKEAFAEALRDGRAGDRQDAQNDWMKLTGGDVVGYKHLGNPGTTLPSFGSWGYYNNISDTTSEPGASTAAWIAANP